MKTQQILENKKPHWPDWLCGRSLIEDCTGIVFFVYSVKRSKPTPLKCKSTLTDASFAMIDSYSCLQSSFRLIFIMIFHFKQMSIKFFIILLNSLEPFSLVVST